MISERISNNIPSQMKILNMVIPILMHCCSFIPNLSVKATCHLTKYEVINDVKLFLTVSEDILSQIFEVIQSDVTLQKQVHQNTP